ncbi:hypothetical protein [Weissella sagaensis]|uniref:hypothetical protein n=1 Tax=Weissella sagaensis TaxID=2559928 RepID=UPI0013EB3FD5|nr:hypothetical protein [Weissella sagaensis]
MSTGTKDFLLALQITFNNFIAPMIAVLMLLGLIYFFWDELALVLKVISRIISLGFLMVAWFIFVLTDGKKVANKRIKGIIDDGNSK